MLVVTGLDWLLVHVGQTLDQVHADIECDRVFTAEHAVEYGLVNRVIEHQ